MHATAYNTDGEIDAALTAKIVERIARAGVHNIVTGGNTGEFYSMTVDEVIRLQAIAVKAANGKATVTAAAGRSVRDAIKVSKAAQAEGADGVMIHHPLDPLQRLMRRLITSLKLPKRLICRSLLISAPI